MDIDYEQLIAEAEKKPRYPLYTTGTRVDIYDQDIYQEILAPLVCDNKTVMQVGATCWFMSVINFVARSSNLPLWAEQITDQEWLHEIRTNIVSARELSLNPRSETEDGTCPYPIPGWGDYTSRFKNQTEYGFPQLYIKSILGITEGREDYIRQVEGLRGDHDLIEVLIDYEHDTISGLEDFPVPNFIDIFYIKPIVQHQDSYEVKLPMMIHVQHALNKILDSLRVNFGKKLYTNQNYDILGGVITFTATRTVYGEQDQEMSHSISWNFCKDTIEICDTSIGACGGIENIGSLLEKWEVMGFHSFNVTGIIVVVGGNNVGTILTKATEHYTSTYF